MEKDNVDEDSMVVSLKQNGVFQDGGDTLRNIINKHVVTPMIQESLLSVPSCLLTDAQTFVMALGKPPDILTFGERKGWT
ncbi:hypothetical protein LSH36_1484g00008 [Paralvinella palmiformis]|uniref:Uncharacterized protein n=1 Tax=Paralvinella palmiformis TaxID=53620 RepID=A0AAD9IU32_9ANNE|nr:hypothetical protein LSH36_1484g00008 [Paralvinella palmiformis]